MMASRALQSAVAPDRFVGNATEQAYPLRRWFLRLILPGLVAWGIATMAAAWFGAGGAIEEVYLDVTERQIVGLEGAIANAMPRAWQSFLSAPSATEFLATRDGLRLQHAILAESAQWNAGAPTLYAPDGRVLFATDAALIDTHPRDAEVRRVTLMAGALKFAVPNGSSGTAYHWFVPGGPHPGHPDLVIEVASPVSAMHAIIWRNLLAPMAVLALLMIVLIVGSVLVVQRAQALLDRHAQLLVELRQRLERYVSRSAVEAAQSEALGGVTAARRLRCTLLYADVRSFTGFAEAASPEAVASFLTDIATAISLCAHEHRGDVDKFVGDGALIRFEGNDREQRAVAAARAILEMLDGRHLPRNVGIGLFDGVALLTVIGAGARRDFTIVGDSVNIAARLCEAAAPGEIVADEALLVKLADRGREFGVASSLAIRGRAQPLRVRRWPARAREADISGACDSSADASHPVGGSCRHEKLKPGGAAELQRRLR
jgi:adenylate cyclase